MKIGTIDIINPMLGTVPVNRVMSGSLLVWERNVPTPPVSFARFNGTDARVTGIPNLSIAGQSWAIEVRCRRLTQNRTDWVLTMGNTVSTNYQNIYLFFQNANAAQFYVRGVTSAGFDPNINLGFSTYAFQTYKLEYDSVLQRYTFTVNGQVGQQLTSAQNYTSTGNMWLADRIDSVATANGNIDIDYVKVWRNGVEVLHTAFNDGTITDAYGKTGTGEGTIQFLTE